MSRANAESITIPFGVGICGNVAETKETINIKDAYEVMSRILLLTRGEYRMRIHIHTCVVVVENHSKSLILQQYFQMRHFWRFLSTVYQEFAFLQQYYCRITHLPVSDDLVLYLILYSAGFQIQPWDWRKNWLHYPFPRQHARLQLWRRSHWCSSNHEQDQW